MPLREDWFEAERLHRAAEEGDLVAIEALVATGCDLALFDDLGHTPLHRAVACEHYKAAKLLLSRGANVNANDDQRAGETPLGLAVQRNYPEMVQLLLEHGADPDTWGWMGLTPRIRAQQRTDEDGRKIFALVERFKPSKLNPGAKKRSDA
jgi:ankyrin repeat protein